MEITPEIQSTVAKGIALGTTMLLTGALARYLSVKVNYTRKVVHISYFIWPQLLDILLLK